jgi:hypothetical protein
MKKKIQEAAPFWTSMLLLIGILDLGKKFSMGVGIGILGAIVVMYIETKGEEKD